MKTCYANYFNMMKKEKKGQMKIQEMAFVLVAVMIFFGLVVLFYLTIRISTLRESAASLQAEEAAAMAKKLAGTPEFAWTTSDCSHCIDLDKAMALKNMTSYKELWGLDYLKIERIYPSLKGECEPGNYPNCQSITIIEKAAFGAPASAFVALCRNEFESGERYDKCEIGKIYATKKGGGK